MSAFCNVIKTILFGSVILLLPLLVAAQSDPEWRKFYVGMGMGAGWLKLSQNNQRANFTARYALSLYGGYQPFPWLRVGINVSGWLIEPYGNFYDDPDNGISVSNNNVQLMLLPFKHHRLSINLQGGRATYTNHHPGHYNAKGTGIKAGLGYEIKIKPHLVIPVTINYGTGDFNDVRYPGILVELLVGITYR